MLFLGKSVMLKPIGYSLVFLSSPSSSRFAAAGAAAMKVVALVSGGKDSCYAMMRCIHFGHEVVALANLLPENDAVDELDSYMYQTVGHQIVEGYAKCMGLPLFRKRIRGKAKTMELRYAQTDGDEVEDLEELLRVVKKQVPSIGAVSSGAIASDYQRLRVENVCSRLGLVSLAYLWKQDQAELLQQMVDSGISAILIKVAAMGLHPHKHLGKELSVMYPVLTELHERYGCNICGEGGEYESLTLDCPLFKNARIVLDESCMILETAESVVQVGYLHPKEFHLEPKGPEIIPEQNGIVHWVVDDEKESQGRQLVGKARKLMNENDIECGVAVFDQSVTICCWHSVESNEGAATELSLLLDTVQKELMKENLGWADVLYIHLYIEDMKTFTEVNGVYSQHITEAECSNGVPSRSTVEVPLVSCGLGEVMVEVLAAKDKSKKVLHVQSISCWAPSCIGPYSQATLHGNLLSMAGQIGLDPPTMNLVASGAQTRQCLQNAEAIAETFRTTLDGACISMTVYCSLTTQRNDVEDCLLSFFKSGRMPLILFVVVSSLPKGASVELEPLLVCSCGYDDAANLELAVRKKATHTLPETTLNNKDSVVISSDCYVIPGQLCRALVSVDWASSTPSEDAIAWFLELLSMMLAEAGLSWSDLLAFRVYFSQREKALLESLRKFIGARFSAPLMVPVHGIGYDSELKFSLTFDLLARGAIHK